MKNKKTLLAFLLLVLVISFAFTSTSYAQTITFPNPLQFDTVEGVLDSLLNSLQGIIVVISIIFIVIGALLYITSAGDERRITTAKSAITASMIGLAIGIAAPSFLREISVIMGWAPGAAIGSLTLAEIALNALNFLLSIVGVIGIIMLVVSGVMYLTSAGDERKIDTAKAMTKWAIIGITVALASLAIVTQISRFF